MQALYNQIEKHPNSANLKVSVKIETKKTKCRFALGCKAYKSVKKESFYAK